MGHTFATADLHLSHPPPPTKMGRDISQFVLIDIKSHASCHNENAVLSQLEFALRMSEKLPNLPPFGPHEILPHKNLHVPLAGVATQWDRDSRHLDSPSMRITTKLTNGLARFKGSHIPERSGKCRGRCGHGIAVGLGERAREEVDEWRHDDDQRHSGETLVENTSGACAEHGGS